MDFDSVWTLFVFIIGIGGWILDRMKKMKEENAKRVRGAAAPSRPAPVQDEAKRELDRAPADPFEDLRRFLEEAQRREERPRPQPAPPPPSKPRPVVVQKVERPARPRPPRPPERVVRPELLRAEKPVRRVVPPESPPKPEPAARQPVPEAARPPRGDTSLRAGLRGRRSLRAALVASEVLGPPASLRPPGSRVF